MFTKFFCASFISNVCCFFHSGPPRDGDRPRFGDRDGYRGGPRGPAGEFGGEKGGAPADYQPNFRVMSISLVATLTFIDLICTYTLLLILAITENFLILSHGEFY